MMHDEEAKGPAKKGPASASFTKEELRELFRLNLDTDCDTRALVHGTAAGSEWETGADVSMHGPLKAAVATGLVSFVYQGPSKDPGASAGVGPAKAMPTRNASQEGPSAAKFPMHGTATTSPRPHAAQKQASRAALAPMDSNLPLTSKSSYAATKEALSAEEGMQRAANDDDVACLEVDMG